MVVIQRIIRSSRTDCNKITRPLTIITCITLTFCSSCIQSVASMTLTRYGALTSFITSSSISGTVSSEGERGGVVRVGSTASHALVWWRAAGRTNKLRIVDQSILSFLTRCVVEVDSVNLATISRVSDAKTESIGSRRGGRSNGKSSSI